MLECLYQRLIDATIHDKKQQVQIIKAIGRDIQKEKVNDLITQLEDWVKQIEIIESTTGKQIAKYNDNVSSS